MDETDPPRGARRTVEAESPVLSGLGAPPSVVARRDSPLPILLGAVAIAAIGAIVFSQLNAARLGRRAAADPALRPVLQPAAMLSPVPVTPATNLTVQMPGAAAPATPAAPSSPEADAAARWKAPSMVVDLGEEAPAAPAAAAGGEAHGAANPEAAGHAQGAAEAPASADERFADRLESGTGAATRLRDTALIAPQGTVIAAITETGINLDLPGYVRAVVSRDVRGFDGTTVLIPRGSHLIGQYRAGVASGQTRAFVVWSRVLTPEGVSVDIASPGADRLGRSGLEGETNTHFFRRFGNAILLSILSTGLEAAATNGNSSTAAIVIGSQQQASNIASIALQKEINIPDTVTVAQGTPIRVFIARDLDFSGVAARRR